MTAAMRMRRLIAAAVGAPLLVAAPVAAEPGPGSAEVRSDTGAVIATHTGTDALAAATATVASARTDDTRTWSVVVGAGTYGDVVVAEPNVTLRSLDGAAVAISGAGAANDTGGGCVDVTRGGVVLQGLACINPAGHGIEVRPPAADGGIVLRRLTITSPGSHGILVSSGSGVTIEHPSITGAAAGADGIRLQGLTGAGPYRIEGGVSRANSGDGIDLEGAQRVQIAGIALDGNSESGIEIDGAANFDVAVDGITARGNVRSGALLTGGANRITLVNATFTGNRGTGVTLGQLASPSISGLRFDGTNAGGDLRLTTDVRTGGSYTNLAFIDTPLTLPNEPRGVVVSSATAAHRRGLSRLPARTTALGKFVRVRDTGPGTSIVRLRFLLTAADLVTGRQSGIRVYEDDPPANRRRWQLVPGSRIDPGGFAEARLTDVRIASGSDARFAVYAPLAPVNTPPQVVGVFPPDGGTYVGRSVVVSALVRDDGPLGTGSFRLDLDGRRRGGIELRNGSPVWPFVRLGVGTHTARVQVVDASGRSAERSWSFTVVNFTPRVKRLLSRPRPKQVVRTRGLVRLSILLRDDERISLGRARVRVDGQRVQVRLRGKRLVASIPLRDGRHRIQVIYTDLDGAQVRRGWTFRTVRP
jgi:hypothetical protein